MAIQDHEDWYRASDKAKQKRRKLARFRLHTLLRQRLLGVVRSRGLDEKREEELVVAIASGDLDPYSAAESIVAEVFGE